MCALKHTIRPVLTSAKRLTTKRVLTDTISASGNTTPLVKFTASKSLARTAAITSRTAWITMETTALGPTNSVKPTTLWTARQLTPLARLTMDLISSSLINRALRQWIAPQSNLLFSGKMQRLTLPQTGKQAVPFSSYGTSILRSSPGDPTRTTQLSPSPMSTLAVLLLTKSLIKLGSRFLKTLMVWD